MKLENEAERMNFVMSRIRDMNGRNQMTSGFPS